MQQHLRSVKVVAGQERVPSQPARLPMIPYSSANVLTESHASERQPPLGSHKPHCCSASESPRQTFSISSSRMRLTSAVSSVAARIAATRWGRAIS